MSELTDIEKAAVAVLLIAGRVTQKSLGAVIETSEGRLCGWKKKAFDTSLTLREFQVVLDAIFHPDEVADIISRAYLSTVLK